MATTEPPSRSRSSLPEEAPEGRPVGHWQWLADGRILCEACPRACKLREGQRGLCFVRARSGDRMVLTTWGRSSGFCIDPIEKKPLNHFLPGTPVLSFGTAGCNLACSFCQNWEISASRAVDTSAEEATGESIATAAKTLGCRSVACTYNDPVIFSEYALEVAESCHARDLRMVAVTAGYVEGRAREDFFAGMDAANIDLKAFTETFYRDRCKGQLGVVRDTLDYVVNETPVWVEITTLLIPGLNDSDAELDAMTGWIAERLGPDVPVHFSAFRPEHRLRDRDATPITTLARARRIAQANGLHWVYIGNLPDEGRTSTWCPSCHAKLIGRRGYTLTHYDLKAPAAGGPGACPHCGTAVPGLFEPQPGNWGSRRQSVRIPSIVV